jgi:hypothetical protein
MITLNLLFKVPKCAISSTKSITALTEDVKGEGGCEVGLPEGGVGGPAVEAGPVLTLLHAQAHRTLAHVPVPGVGLETTL